MQVRQTSKDQPQTKNPTIFATYSQNSESRACNVRCIALTYYRSLLTGTMVSTRHQRYSGSPQPPPQQPAPQQPAAQQPAPRKPAKRRPAQQKPAQQKAAQQKSAQQKPAQGGRTKKGGRKAKPTTEADEDTVDEEQDAVEEVDDVEEEVDNDAAPNPKSGRKRPTTDANEGSSRKVRKTRAAGPSNRNATGSEQPSGDAAGVEQGPTPKKGKDNAKGKGKGKEKEEEAAAADDDANVSALFCSVMSLVPLMATHVLMVTSLGLNLQTVHKTISKVENPQKSLQKPGQRL